MFESCQDLGGRSKCRRLSSWSFKFQIDLLPGDLKVYLTVRAVPSLSWLGALKGNWPQKFNVIPRHFTVFGSFKFVCVPQCQFYNWKLLCILCIKDKIITTMVIGPLDDHIYCVRSAFTHLRLWRKLYDCSKHKFRARKCLIKRTLLTFSSISNRLVGNWKEDFLTPILGIMGDVGVVGDVDRPIRQPAHGFPLTRLA